MAPFYSRTPGQFHLSAAEATKGMSKAVMGRALGHSTSREPQIYRET